MRSPTALIPLAMTAALLSACAATPPPVSEPEPAAAAGSTPCIVGDWRLDVDDYAAQAEAYLLGLGLPIEDFAMQGEGSIRFTADGLVAADIALTTTGTIVAGDTSVPVEERSEYTASGDWSQSDDDTTLDLANWSTVPDPALGGSDGDGSFAVPTIDYTDMPAVTAECSTDTLLLQGPGAPMHALWRR